VKPGLSNTQVGSVIKQMPDDLGAAGKQVIVVGVPQTYPVRPVNGYLIPGFLAPCLFHHPDQSLARRIALDLQAGGIDVWRGEWEIHIGESIAQSIQRGLDAADFVAVIMTKNSIESGWVEKEWQSKIGNEAKERQKRNREYAKRPYHASGLSLHFAP
jgi:hypothetical protein